MHRLLRHCHFKKRPPTAHSEPSLEVGAEGALAPPLPWEFGGTEGEWK